MHTIKKLLSLLSKEEQKKSILLLFMILLMAFLDMLGVASILPFIAVLSNPQLIETNEFIAGFYAFGNFQNIDEFLFILGLVVFLVLCFSLTFKALTIFFQLRFALLREYTIGKKLIEGYLHQPYSWFLNRNSADLGKNILSEVSNVVSGGIMPMMDLITKGIAALFLVILLLFIDPKLSIIVAVVLGASYGLVYGLSRKFLDLIGKERLIANHDRYSAVSEAFGAAKEVKVGGLEDVYLKRFSRPAKIFAHNQATARVVEQIPRFVLEAIAFGGLLIVILYLMSGTGTFANSLPILSVYAFAGYRLLPALQQIYAALTQLRFAGASLNALHNDLVDLKPIENLATNKKIEFKNSINLENIFYSYPNSEKLALENLSINIPVKSTIGLVGETGSGKTTTVDLILGLLESQKGKLKVDSKIIDKENLRSWQNCLGYVPQQIFLIDDTIESNIAFGVDQENIDQKALEEAAKISNIHNFIKDELPLGYKTFVGEKGIRLSGGQRQRIGIARALYHRPKVLIFDEATSALDNITEKIIMEAVYNLTNKVTIILIAHRLSTINLCQKIFLIENGKIRSEGNYQELLKKDSRFREMAGE
jgi:ABC-type multidrug transport system fused ATPase/permease subunit